MSVRNTPLPPSVEKAYHIKCQQLKRRLNEIEEANDAARLRKRRIDRSIMKMRLERAFLLERLAKSQQFNTDGADSDKSTSPPPTPQERPPRVRRYRSPPADPPAIAPSSPTLPAASAPAPAPTTTTSSLPRTTAPDPPIDRRGVEEVPEDEQLPLIHSLPNGTNVVILNGRPKQPPWTIRDIEPRHWLKADFERKDPAAQLHEIEHVGYVPYDIHGRPVVVRRDADGVHRHVFEGDPGYVNPVRDNIRTDDLFMQQRQAAAKGRASGNHSSRQPDGSGDHHRHSGESRHKHSGRRSDAGERAASGSASGSVPPGTGRPSSNGGGFTAVNR